MTLALEMLGFWAFLAWWQERVVAEKCLVLALFTRGLGCCLTCRLFGCGMYRKHLGERLGLRLAEVNVYDGLYERF
jgi:hypothetical protein